MSSGNLQTAHLETHERINTETPQAPHERLRNDSEIKDGKEAKGAFNWQFWLLSRNMLTISSN